jgi:pimeloyl-ACP methyl ester carboxylesterase
MRLIMVSLATMLLAACGTVQVGEGNFIHPDSKTGARPDPRLDVTALAPGMAAREESIATPDGAVLNGISLRREGASVAVLYFGGNAFHLDRHGRELLPLLSACGLNVAVFDYRGYGRSSGAPTVATMSADALRIYDHVSAQNPGGVIVHGQSLGSFMAAHVASRRAPRGVVLEATSTTVQEWSDANLPWYLKPFIGLEVAPPLRAIDNVAAMADYRGASMVLAGERDKVTPARLARKVYDAIPAQGKRWFVADGAGHNGIFGHKDVAPVYCGFLKQA